MTRVVPKKRENTLLHVYEAEADDNIFVDILFFLQFYKVSLTRLLFAENGCLQTTLTNTGASMMIHYLKFYKEKFSTHFNCWLKLVQVSSFNEINATI